ncbi:hypothetical protein ACU8DI_14875 [Psychroserpens sp. BH13MA-6]
MIIGALILLLTFEINAQTYEMVSNKNKIEQDFVPSTEFRIKIENQVKSKSEINLILEKVKENQYSIYILNKTSDSIKISKQDWSLYLIQEAKDTNGEWKPIEYWQYASCGNSYLSNKLEPNGIIKTESIAYDGNIETDIRFKLLNENKVYYSNSIIGKISENQFKLPNDIKTKWPIRIMEKIISEQTLNAVVFLKPNGMEDFNKKWETYLENMAELRKNNKN